MFEHFRGDLAYAEPNLNFVGELSKKFVFQNVTLAY